MSTNQTILKIIFTLFFGLFAFSANGLTLSKEETGRRLTSDIYLLEDKSGAMDIETVRSPLVQSQFQPWAKKGDVSLGFSRSAYWLKVSIARQSDAPPNWLIEIPYLSLETIDFYAPGQAPILTGSARAFSSRPIASRYFLLPITPATETQDYYIRVTSQYSLTIPIDVWRPRPFYEDAQRTLTIQALYFGGLLALLIYNFFLWISLKDLRFLLYTMFCSLLGLGIFAGNGFGRLFLWNDASAFDVISQSLLISMSLVFGIQFASLFLKISEVAPQSSRILNITSIISGTVSVLLLASLWIDIPTYWIYQVFIVNSVFAIIFIIWTGISTRHKKITGSRFFLLAWCMLLCGGIVGGLRAFGLVPNNFITGYSVQISSAAEMLLLAFALAEMVKNERDARDLAQRQAFDSSQQLMQVLKQSEERLEKAVEERTEQLRVSLANEKTVLAQYVRFGSLIAHEFRNPLGIIDSQVALLKKELAMGISNSGPRLDTISGATHRLVKMFDQWLSDGKAKPNSRPMQIIAINIPLWLPQFLHENRMFHASHQIEPILNSSVDTLYADKELLDIALVNLVDNACKYSASGSPITISTKRKLGYIGISVIDHGMGIAPEHRELVFEENFRIPSEKNTMGTGLGLPLVKNIVNNHGGHIELQSQTGQGSTFTMWFPEQADASRISDNSKTINA
jgi:two-component system, sensor histidine kinase LadS